jgi:hypothetical protein
MATIAAEVYDLGPADPLAPAGVNPCTFSSALDTVSCLFALNPFIYSKLGSTCMYVLEGGRSVQKSKGCPFPSLENTCNFDMKKTPR